jgi:uncharacterized protein involved in type VI secretion and phage assembly
VVAVVGGPVTDDLDWVIDALDHFIFDPRSPAYLVMIADRRDAIAKLQSHRVADEDRFKLAEWQYQQKEAELAEAHAELAKRTDGGGDWVSTEAFEKAKPLIYSEGMREGCEELMMEAARMDAQLTELQEAVWEELGVDLPSFPRLHRLIMALPPKT